MWGIKKPSERQVAEPEPKNLQGNQPPGPPAVKFQGSNQRDKEVRATGEMMGGVAARLGPNLHVKGEISGDEDLVIDGTFEGFIQLAERKVTIGTTAKVAADIVGAEVVVSGNLKGNVRATNRIEVKKDGSVTGDLRTAEILIEDGAFFKGSIEIERATEKEVHKSAFSQVASASTPPKAAA